MIDFYPLTFGVYENAFVMAYTYPYRDPFPEIML